MNYLLEKWKLQQENIACFLGLCLMAGFLWSRALLSVSITLLFINALHPRQLRDNLRAWFSDPFSRACLLFFIFSLVAGTWSEEVAIWFAALKNKLPFVVLPFAFIAVPLRDRMHRKWLLSGVVFMHLLIILYSLIYLGMHWESSVAGYGASQVLPTTRYNDHIRFSVSLAFCVLLLAHLIGHKAYAFQKIARLFLGLVAVIFILYLHLLASKTGLLVLYCLLIGLVLQRFRAQRWAAVLVSLAALALFVGLAYRSLPTFKNRINYVIWEAQEYQRMGRLDYKYSDAGRLISYELSLKLIGQKPWTGTGPGDVLQEMNRQYERYYPEVPAENRLVPHNQFLFSMTALGIPMGLSVVLLLLSLLRQPKHRLASGKGMVGFASLGALAFLIAFMTEAMLEVQFGIFVFLFYSLLGRFWLSEEADARAKIPSGHGA